MKKKFEQLESILEDIFKNIELHLEIEQIDLKKYEESLESDSFEDDIEIQQKMQNFRETIVKYKEDDSFWSKDIPNLISLLEDSKEKIQSYRKDLSEIGGKDLPNQDIVNLLRQDILTTETEISKTHKGEEYVGHLTTDGFLELEVHGIKKKFTLRKAAFSAWGTDPPNQWTFWEAPDINGEKKSLEEFRKKIKKG